MRWLACLLLAIGCGNGEPALRHDRALGCVIELAARHGGAHDLIFDLADYAPPAAERALAEAIVDHHANDGFDRAQIRADAAKQLALRGARDDARALLDGLGPLPGVYEEVKARIGLPYDLEHARVMVAIRELAIGGDLAAAGHAYDAHPADAAGNPMDNVGALVALGRDDDARAAIAADPKPWLLLIAATSAALERRHDIQPWVDALLAARGDADGGNRYTVAMYVLRFAHGLGEDAAVAPLRQAFLADPVRDDLMDPMLVDLALLAGEEPTLAGDPALRAIDRGTFDEALAATQAYTGRHPATLWARLWLRFRGEARLADAVCAAK